MIPQDKAMELMLMYYELIPKVSVAKKCALIAVDEIIKSNYKVLSGVKPIFYDYWIEVEQEIKKL